LRARWPWIVVGVLTLIGLLLRLHDYGQSLVGDELSTLWIVENHNLADTVSFVKGDGEITPPLYFILAWLATRLGDSPELVRLPAMVAGVVSIPLMYELGLRTAGKWSGLASAAIFTCSPFMIYFSANGRAYSIMTLFLIGSTLAMLAGARTGRARWWVLFGAGTCLAMYSHYTAAFVLGAQLLWLLWACPGARKPALISTAVAAVLFLPWLPGLLSDLDSPTTEILSAIQGSGWTAKKIGIETWAFGHPLMLPGELPGSAVMWAICVGLLIGLASIVFRGLIRAESVRESLAGIPKEYVLVAVLALATPVCEALLLLLGTDLLGARNLTASSYGLLLAMGTIVASAGMVWGSVSAVLVLGGFAVAAGKSMEASAGNPDFIGAADYIEAESAPDDVVIDAFGAGLSPVPLAPMDFYLRDGQPLYHLNRPSTPPPFLPFTTVIPSQDKLLQRAFRQADGRSIYIVKPDALQISSVDDPGHESLDPTQPHWADRELILPRGTELLAAEPFDSLDPPTVLVIRAPVPQAKQGQQEEAAKADSK